MGQPLVMVQERSSVNRFLFLHKSYVAMSMLPSCLFFLQLEVFCWAATATKMQPQGDAPLRVAPDDVKDPEAKAIIDHVRVGPFDLIHRDEDPDGLR